MHQTLQQYLHGDSSTEERQTLYAVMLGHGLASVPV